MAAEETTSSLAGYLVVNSGTPEAYFFELEEGKVLEIGRKPGNPVGPKRLVIPVPEVSGHHAELRPSPNGWVMRDVGSTNGTRLNGDWLSANQDYLLKNGDHIKISQVDLIVNLPDHLAQRVDEPKHEEDEHERTQLHIKLMTATILVADIRGFTTLMEHYSDKPDLVMQAAQIVFSRAGDLIKKNLGHVEKIAGDAVMAYWQGDDAPTKDANFCAYQSCFTALKMRDLVKQVAANRDEWPFPDYPLEVDMSLATGPVAAGVLGAGKSSLAVLGDTANLAFRLEKLIEKAGDIILDGATYDMVRDRVQVDSLGPVSVKGRQRPVDIYRLISVS